MGKGTRMCLRVGEPVRFVSNGVTRHAWCCPISNHATRSEAKLKVLASIVFGLGLMVCSAAPPRPSFMASDVPVRGAELLLADLDGDGLQDLIMLDEFKLSIFYQDAKGSFPREPQQGYQLEARPCVLWAVQLGQPAASVLVMTSDGVRELCFTNRAGPPARQQIIRQPTLIPSTAETTNAVCLSLSAETQPRYKAGPASNHQRPSAPTGSGWPLLLVPAADGLQVWQHHNEWRQAQVIAAGTKARLWPSLANPGYTAREECNLSIGDVNGDGRDDLMLRRDEVTGDKTYSLYLQQSNGLFNLEPVMTYTDTVQPHAWLCWADINHDGRVDLIKGVWLNEPSFVPGVPSPKVVVSIYLADEHGRIPARPQQVLRKNDWMPELPVLDLDGDGYQDVVLGYSRLDSREGVRKQLTAKQLDYSMRFFFFRPGTGFPQEADFQRDVLIHLDLAGLMLSWSLPQNFARYVKVGGDFNGDGKADLLVRDSSDEISVYRLLSREQGFSPQADLRFHCPEPLQGWQVMDLNHDGISDLIVKLAKDKGYRIFVSQK